MNLRKLILWVVLSAIAAIAVEGSILLRSSLLRPRLPEPCFSCRAEDRPYAYTLVSYLGGIKDMVVKGLNALVDKTKQYKLDTKL